MTLVQEITAHYEAHLNRAEKQRSYLSLCEERGQPVRDLATGEDVTHIAITNADRTVETYKRTVAVLTRA